MTAALHVVPHRSSLYADDQSRCVYCDREFDQAWYGGSKTKDHIIPRNMQLGDTAFAGRGNCVSACGACNQLKSNMLPSAMRVMADEHRKRAALLDQIADRVDTLIAKRRLMPAPLAMLDQAMSPELRSNRP